MAVGHAISGLFHCRGIHVCEIKKRIERSFKPVWPINHARFYSNLKTFKAEGLISNKESDHPGISGLWSNYIQFQIINIGFQ